MIRTKTNYAKALLQIRELEEQYGSIALVPDYEPRLERIHSLMNHEHAIKPMNFSISDEKIKQIEYLIKFGYTTPEIASRSLVNSCTVLKVMHASSIKPRRVFTYVAIANDMPSIYFTSFTALAMGFRLGSSDKTNVSKKLKNKGYSITKNECYWGEMPDGSVYLLRGSTLYEKDGIDSYGKKSASFRFKE